jgi:hypothetical protein
LAVGSDVGFEESMQVAADDAVPGGDGSQVEGGSVSCRLDVSLDGVQSGCLGAG